jgi:hypothetical protein
MFYPPFVEMEYYKDADTIPEKRKISIPFLKQIMGHH